MAKSYLKYEIKDGSTVRFWTDIWHPRGRLIEFAGEIGTHRLGIRRDMKIKDVFRDGVWRFRRCRDPFIRSMIAEIEASNICLTDGRDAVLWKRGADDYVSKFVSSETRAVNWVSPRPLAHIHLSIYCLWTKNDNVH